jgi:hypothetical protein
MKEWFDVNKSWTPPPLGELKTVAAKGSFLQLTYVYDTGKGEVIFDVYLNDQGREVGRLGTTYEREKEDTASPVSSKLFHKG